MNFKLSISITQQKVEQINDTNQQITLVRRAKDRAPRQVVWASIKPNQINQIEWNNSYHIYASTNSFGGTPIVPNTLEKNASNETYYIYTGEKFQSSRLTYQDSRFIIMNEANRMYTFGLCQDIGVNQTSPTSRPITASRVFVGQQLQSYEPTDLIVFISDFLDGELIESHIIDDMMDSYLNLNGLQIPSPRNLIPSGGSRIGRGIKLDYSHKTEYKLHYSGNRFEIIE